MNYLQARQRQTDKRWDYTQMNDGLVWPIGYCHEFREPREDEWYWTEEEKQKLFANRDKYHADGHATEDEARECYKRYQLDTRLRFDGFNAYQQERCKICDAWTQKSARVGAWHHWHLCDQHLNRESVETLYSVDSSMES